MARPVASTPHLVWAAGHFFVFLSGLRFLLGVFTFNTPNLRHWYTIAYLGAIISYGVVVYKSFGIPQLNKAYIQRAAFDENVQYLLLAIYWWFNKPIFITLVPYVTFSLFHVLTFLRTTVIPMAFPNSSSAPSRTEGQANGPAPAPARASKFIQAWVKANYDPAMRFVAYAEVAIFARVLFGAMIFKNSLLAPLLYAHFLRLRFYMSSFTRGAFQHVGSVLDGYTQHPNCPPAVRRGYLMTTDLISRYASTVLSVQNQGAAPNGANAAAGRGPAANAGAGTGARRT